MSAPRGWRQHAVVAVVLSALVAAAYANSLQGGFPFDNRFQILEDVRLQAVTVDNVRRLFTEDLWWPRAVSGLYRPITKVTFLANYAALGNGDRPLGYHLVNLALHLLNALLVYRLALDIGMPLMSAFWSAAFFATHPVATEAVTNLVGRADLLAALVVLGGLLLYRRLQTQPSAAQLIALGVSTAFGVLAKENAAILLGMMLLSDLTFRRRPIVSGYAAVALPIIAVWLWRAHLYANLPAPDLPFVDNPIVAVDFWTQRLTALDVLARYFGLLVWPATLACDYGFRQITPSSWTDPLSLGGLTLAALLVALAVRMRRRRPVVAFLIGFFFVALLPTSNLVFPVGSIMAERFLYLPLVGFAGGLAVAIPLVLRRPRLAAVVSSCIVLAYCGRTAVRNRDWQDSLPLWSSAVAAVPQNFRAHQSLGLALFHGRNDLEGAIAELERAREILAGLPPEHTDPPRYTNSDASMRQGGSGGRQRAHALVQRAAEVLGEAAQANRVRSTVFRARRRHTAVARTTSPISATAASSIITRSRSDAREPPRGDRTAPLGVPSHARPGRSLQRAGTRAPDGPRARARGAGTARSLGDRARRCEHARLFAQAARAIPDAGCALRNVNGRLVLDRTCPWLATQTCRARRTLVAELRAAQATARADALMAEAGSCSDSP